MTYAISAQQKQRKPSCLSMYSDTIHLRAIVAQRIPNRKREYYFHKEQGERSVANNKKGYTLHIKQHTRTNRQGWANYPRRLVEWLS